jgi:hypothetical protein
MPHAEVLGVNGHHDIVNDLSHREVAREIRSFIARTSTLSTSYSTSH